MGRTGKTIRYSHQVANQVILYNVNAMTKTLRELTQINNKHNRAYPVSISSDNLEQCETLPDISFNQLRLCTMLNRFQVFTCLVVFAIPTQAEPNLDNGKEHYKVCTTCHGPEGEGSISRTNALFSSTLP